MDFEKCIQLYNHQHSEDREILFTPKHQVLLKQIFLPRL